MEESAEAFIRSYIEFCNTMKNDRKLTIHLVCRNHADKTTVVEVFNRKLQKNKSEIVRQDTSDDSEPGKVSLITFVYIYKKIVYMSRKSSNNRT